MKSKVNIVEHSVAEIQLKLKEKHDELMSMRLKQTTGQVEKTHLIKLNRKTIARLETALRTK